MVQPNFLLPVLILLLSLNIARAQDRPTQVIKGTIVDQESEQPIIGANIILPNSDPFLGASTDENGRFRIENVPLGRHNLALTCIGYEDAQLSELEVGSGKEVILNLRMTESLIQMEAVVVRGERLNGTPNNEMASVSARSFTVEQTKRYAASVNDPARMALSFAGVTSNDDGENQIIIRGNSPRGVLWRMEGIEIPNPNHFAQNGASGGAISALSVNVLANSDFMTGAFPAEYGNASSGVFDLRMRAGNNEKREYAFQAGLLGLDAAAEGPIGPAGGASYLANYRYSTLSLLGELGVFPTDGEQTTFQDAAFKVHVPLAGNNFLSVWGLGGLSRQEFQEEGSGYDYYSDRGMTGLNYRRFLGEDAYLETILSYSIDRQGEDYHDIEDAIVFRENYTNEAFRASVLYNRKIDSRHTIRIGAVGHRLAYDLFQEVDDAGEVNRYLDEKGNTFLAQAYGQWKYRLRSNLSLNAGIHSSMLSLNNQVTVEPRVGMRWNYRAGSVLTMGAGLHSRLDPLPVYFARVEEADRTTQPNQDLAISKAAHFVIGHEWRFAPQWRLQTELYYQHLYDIPIGTPTTDDPFLLSQSWLNAESGFVADSLVSDGTGRNYGIEITVEKFFTNGWYALSTTSLYRSLYTARDGVERSTRFDGGFVQNLLLGKEWTVGRRGKNLFGANIRTIVAGGNRYTPIDLEQSLIEDGTERIWSRAYDEQLPVYFRADVRISYRMNKAKTSSVISLDIQNVANRENVFNRYYDSDENKIIDATQLGLIPILNYRLEF